MRNLILTFLFLVVSLTLITVFVGVPKVNTLPVLSKVEPHMYENASSSLQKINITIFYFVPKDVVHKKITNWKELALHHVKDLQEFHNKQFLGTSEILYSFYPNEVIGLETTSEYESLFEQSDRDALTPIKEELSRRFLFPTGDLYVKENKDIHNPSNRNVYLVILEGKGAAGNGDFALISRHYLTEKAYEETGTTFLAHEFYHTLGIPDNYQTASYVFRDGKQVPVSLVTQKDIMGQVNIPIVHTYIETNTLKKMGL